LTGKPENLNKYFGYKGGAAHMAAAFLFGFVLGFRKTGRLVKIYGMYMVFFPFPE